MSYPQPPQWGPQGYYPPPTPPPQKSNTGKTLLLLVLGGMCVICTVPVVLSKPFRDGFREENERLNRVANGEQEEPQATRTAPPDGGTMAPLEPAQVSPAAPPDDSDLVDFPDNRRRRSDDSLANIPTAIGHLESPAPPGSTPQPEVATRLRERFAGHCVGRGRRRRCPTWFVLLAGDELDVSRDASGAWWVRAPTMIPRSDATGRRAALNLCNAARYEMASALDAGVVNVEVFQWDGRTLGASSAGGEACR